MLPKVNLILSWLSLTLNSNNNTTNRNTQKLFRKYLSNKNKGEFPIVDIPKSSPTRTSINL
jgi:hypothetical protein